MAERFLNVGIKLAVGETPVEAGIENYSKFLRVGHSFNLGHVIGNAAPELYAGLNYSELWADLKPKEGLYSFELATELPFYLPTVEGKHEYLIKVGESELFVCLRMVRAFCGNGLPQEDGLKYILCHRLALPSLIDLGKHGEFHPVPIRTFICRRFSCHAASAQEAIQNNLISWRGEFVSQIVHLIDAMRVTDSEAAKFLTPQPSLAFYPFFWLMAIGEGEQTRCEQFLASFERGTFIPQSDIKANQLERLKKLLEKPEAVLSDDHALALARTFCNFGHFELAVLEVCVACEIALSQKYWLFLKERGVSNTKIKDNKKEITFSQLLNVHLFTMRDLSAFVDSEKILGALNWARNVRNDVVHEGKPEQELNVKNVTDVINAAESLLAFLRG